MSSMDRRSSITLKKFSPWLILLSVVGLSGFLLAKRKSKPLSIDKQFDSSLTGSGYESMRPLIFAQAQVESANFQSNLFESQNNAFGMKNAFTRNQLGFPVSNTDFRGYGSLNESIQDFVLWLKFTNFPLVTDVNTYVRRLKERSYFEESQTDYINALNSWI